VVWGTRSANWVRAGKLKWTLVNLGALTETLEETLREWWALKGTLGKVERLELCGLDHGRCGY